MFHWHLDLEEHFPMKYYFNFKKFILTKYIQILVRLQNVSHFANTVHHYVEIRYTTKPSQGPTMNNRTSLYIRKLSFPIIHAACGSELFIRGLCLYRKYCYPTDIWRNNGAMITSSLRQNDVGDVVWTQWRRYYCVVCPLGSLLVISSSCRRLKAQA